MLWEIYITIHDEKRQKSRMKLYFHDDNVADYEAVATFARLFVEYLDPFIGGVITSVSLRVAVDLSAVALKTTADPDSDVEEGAMILYDGTDSAGVPVVSPPAYRHRVPTFKELYLDNDAYQAFLVSIDPNFPHYYDPFFLVGATHAHHFNTGFVGYGSNSRGDELPLYRVVENFKKSRRRR